MLGAGALRHILAGMLSSAGSLARQWLVQIGKAPVKNIINTFV